LRASENRTRISSGIAEALYRFEVTQTFTTPESFVAGISGPRLSNALPLSYAGFRLRQESNLRHLVSM